MAFEIRQNPPLILFGSAAGLSWICSFKALQPVKVSQLATVDKLSVAIAILSAVSFMKVTLTHQSPIGAALIPGGTS